MTSRGTNSRDQNAPATAADTGPAADSDTAADTSPAADTDTAAGTSTAAGADAGAGTGPDGRSVAGAETATDVHAAAGTFAQGTAFPAPEMPPVFDAVVLAGGGARRLDGADKPGLRVGGRRLLDRVLAACAEASSTVVVAEERAVERPVLWTREDPPGGGPLAALGAGAALCTAPYVVLLSADLPFLGRGTVHALLEHLEHRERGEPREPGELLQPSELLGPVELLSPVEPPGPGEPLGSVETPGRRDEPGRAADEGGAGTAADAVLLVDADGREQPLVGAYRRTALMRRLGRIRDEHGSLDGRPLRLLTQGLRVERLRDPDASFDCDTWGDLAKARTRIREHGRVLEEWIAAVKDELGVEIDVDTTALLDLARDAAHSVARPAAPLTTFLVGYAAAMAAEAPSPGGADPGGRRAGATQVPVGRNGLTAEERVAEAARKASALALRWADEETSGPDDKSPDSGQAPGAAAPDAG